ERLMDCARKHGRYGHRDATDDPGGLSARPCELGCCFLTSSLRRQRLLIAAARRVRSFPKRPFSASRSVAPARPLLKLFLLPCRSFPELPFSASRSVSSVSPARPLLKLFLLPCRSFPVAHLAR